MGDRNVPESDYQRGRREAIEDAARHLRTSLDVMVRTIMSPLAAADEIESHEAEKRRAEAP